MSRTRTQFTPRGFTLATLRINRGWSQKQLSQASGWSQAAIKAWEKGSRSLANDTLHQLAVHMSYEPPQVEGLLFGLSGVVEPFESLAEAPLPTVLRSEDLRRVRLEAVRHGVLQTREREARLLAKACAERIARERAAAEALVGKLLPRTPEEREALLERNPGAGFHSWAFVERACEQCLRELPGDAKSARAWAVLALHSSVADDPAVEARLIGYSFAFLGHALRAAQNYEHADEAFNLAAASWEKGRAATALPLAEWRIFELDAALHRELGKGDLALVLHERALEAATPDDRPLLLLSRAETLESLDRSRDALDSLLLAHRSLGEGHSSDLRIRIGWKLADLLSRLGRIQEAVHRLAEVRARAIEERKDQELSLCLWLQARCEAAMDRAEGAIKGYQRARAECKARQRCHETVEITLELAELYLRENETAQAHRLAEELGWARNANGLPPSARESLERFRQAAPNGSAMLRCAEKGLAELRKSRPRMRP